MARRPRTVFPGIPHHITQRGNDRQEVFFSAEGRRYYLLLLGRHAARHGVHILGYCLMTNHVHLVAVPDAADSLAHVMARLNSEYAQALNRIQERSGHLWQNRFYSCPLDERHFVNALRYTDLNPVRAGLVARALDWPWSSAAVHASEILRDECLDRDWVDLAGGWDYCDWKNELEASATDGVADGLLRRATYTGEPLGSLEFVAELERRAGRRLRVLKNGRPKKQLEGSGDAAAQDLLFAGS